MSVTFHQQRIWSCVLDKNDTKNLKLMINNILFHMLSSVYVLFKGTVELNFYFKKLLFATDQLRMGHI